MTTNITASFLLAKEMTRMRGLFFYMPLYKLIYIFISLLPACSQEKPISHSSSSDFSKSKYPIARGGFTSPFIIEIPLWNAGCFQGSKEVKDENKWQLFQTVKSLKTGILIQLELG